MSEAKALATQAQIKSALQDLRIALNLKFVERKDVIDVTLIGLLAQENVFVLGPPGTAKSLLAREICNAITGGKGFFDWLISKVTTPDELFGSVDIPALKESRYQRVTTGKLPEANIAFLDEIFKGSSAILNTLLPIMNERIFHNGLQPTKVPLQMIVGASNEIPSSEELGAMYDRFALRVEVDYIKNEERLLELLLGTLDAVVVPSLSPEQLAFEQAAIHNVTFGKEAATLLLELKKAVKNAGFFVSDRKWKQSVKIIRAYTHLNGRTDVTAEDLEVLEFVLWNEPGQRKEIRRLISKIANPVGEVIMKVMDGVEEVFENLRTSLIQPLDAANKIKTAQKQLEKAGNPKDNPKLNDAIERCKLIKMQIAKDYLGLGE